MMPHKKQESEIRFSRSKNKLFMLFLTAVMLFILNSTLFYDAVYSLFSSFRNEEAPEQEQSKSSFALRFSGYDLTANTRQNLLKEFASYNIRYTDYNFYAPKGRLLDRDGNVIYSMQTQPVFSQTFYEQGRNRVCKYLYGDIPGTEGISALMRTVPNVNPDSLADALPAFPEGYDIQLSLDTELEMQIYDLLAINQIKGGCIIQDLPTGQIEVMTATSITSAESEKSCLTQLEASLNSDFLLEKLSALSPDEQEQTKQFFDYQRRSAESQQTDPESGEITKILKYCFTTDFDLILEQPDNMKASDSSEISPLHMNSITQRIFSAEARVPSLLLCVKDSQGKEQAVLPEYPVQDGKSLSVLKSLKSEYENHKSQNFKNYQISVLKYQSGRYTDFKYATGVIRSADKKIQKAFTLYSRDEKILQFVDSLVYFLDASSQPEGGMPLESETVPEGD